LNLFGYLKMKKWILTSVSHDGYIDENKSKYITELQITERKQINGKANTNLPPSAAGFTYLGGEAPLVKF
jgi:hypothetical protein